VFGLTESGSGSESESRAWFAMENDFPSGAAIPEEAAVHAAAKIDTDSDSDSDPEAGSGAVRQQAVAGDGHEAALPSGRARA